MAEISLKIKSDFDKAAADFKNLDLSSAAFQKSLAKMQAQMNDGSIDKFMNKNKLNATAMTATKGATAGLTAELSGLQREMARLIKAGIDPLNPALDKMKSRMSQIQGQLPQTQSSMSGLGSSVMSLAKGFVAYQLADKIYEIGKSSLMAAANMEKQTVAFTTMLGSAGAADSLLLKLQEFAASTPFSFNELTDASKKLLAFGVTTQEMIPTMRQLGDVSAGLGIPFGDLADIYGKIKTSNRIMGDDLRQLGGRGIPIVAELAKVYKTTEANIYKMSEAGKFGFKDLESVMKNLTGEGSRFGGMMDAQAKTLSGKWSNFGDNLDRIAVTIGKKMAPAAESFLDLMNRIMESDISESQREMNDMVAKTQELLKYEQQYGVETMNQSGFKDDLIYMERMQGIHIDINKTAAERLEIYKGITAAMKAATSDEVLYSNDAHGRAMKAKYGAGGEDGKPKGGGGGGGTKKTEAQIMQEQLVKSAGFENEIYQQRLKAAEDFFTKKAEMELGWGEDAMAWQFEQATLIASNDKLTQDQKLAAMKALEIATQKHSQKLIQNQLQYGAQMTGSLMDMVGSLQTVMKNAGKESRTLAIMMKALAIGQAMINTSLAITNALARSGPPWVGIAMAAVVGAAGAAQVAAIASTPISAETGLSNYTVPDIRSNRNDGAAVMAQGGEQVTVTPRGEESSKVTSVNISIGETQLFTIIQRGINTGQINVSNKNVGSAVFAR